MHLPGPRGLDALSTVLEFRRDPLRALLSLKERYGDVVAFRYGPLSRVLVTHPEGIHRILQDNHRNYNKDSPFYHMLKWFLGEGLATSDGELWLRQRRMAQPAFARARLEALAPMMVDCSRRAVQRWAASVRLDAAAEMTSLTLEIIGRAIFSQDLSHPSHGVGQAVAELQRQMQQRFLAFFPLPPVLPTARDRRFRAVRSRVRALCQQRVEQRRRERDRPDDLLTALLEARDPQTGRAMPDEQLQDELVTFLLTGHETVASMLAWVLFLLSRHPDVRRRLESEVDDAIGGRACSVADLAAIPLSERALLESLRLYPPVGVFGRRSLGPDELCGYPIGAGQIVSMAPYVVHRDPTHWPNPEGFDPDRFLVAPARGTFVPFAAGPRQCIGNHFGLMEARLILVTLAQKVRLNLLPGARVEPDPQVTLRPRGGLPMTVELRHGSINGPPA